VAEERPDLILRRLLNGGLRFIKDRYHERCLDSTAYLSLVMPSETLLGTVQL
jgi:hypothetical protein